MKATVSKPSSNKPKEDKKVEIEEGKQREQKEIIIKWKAYV